VSENGFARLIKKAHLDRDQIIRREKPYYSL
jgi:hypothetical protein